MAYPESGGFPLADSTNLTAKVKLKESWRVKLEPRGSRVEAVVGLIVDVEA